MDCVCVSLTGGFVLRESRGRNIGVMTTFVIVRFDDFITYMPDNIFNRGLGGGIVGGILFVTIFRAGLYDVIGGTMGIGIRERTWEASRRLIGSYVTTIAI